MVERFAGYPTAGGPGRNDDAGNPETASNREAFYEFVRRSGRRYRRWNVIEQAVVLVVVEDEHRFGPHVRVGCDGVDLARHERGSVRRHVVGMLGLIAG